MERKGLHILLSCLSLVALLSIQFADAGVPAIYVFRDSSADVGNNNYLSMNAAKAKFPFNGIDFPGGVPTGRFGNGYVVSDYMGLKELKSACCGGGRLNGESPCTPNATYCSNQHRYMFWDRVHPSQATYKLTVQAFSDDGSSRSVYPITFKQLACLRWHKVREISLSMEFTVILLSLYQSVAL
ncbi:GDSL esterase/lipase EXL2 [Acorus calamus]|uniref:GDSL esterase/lipase EXL2 n=1 Tax=Acorus calamus TaxID=4465 RepID=A0AAV9FG92_ACOCL|nr:GDSL esterase/lipase EXL2 [Acorus calamus]